MDILAQRGAGSMTPAVRYAVSRLPRVPGVYRFRDQPGDVLYIGRATDLRARVASYWSKLHDRRHLAAMVPAIASVQVVACGSVHEAAWLERNLLETYKPGWNRAVGGQEVQVYIRLNTGRARPGLTVCHVRQECADTRYYGPYLGGLRARLAVRGLRRLAPLEYSFAGDDAARLRGTARQLAEVLHREAGAVCWARASLEHLRDRASAVLAFELAGKIQEEIEALGWITSQQRVTTMEPADFEVTGWHHGVVVMFGVLAGRLRYWSQLAGARPPAPTTPLRPPPAAWPELAEFAQHSAELAARLRSDRH